MERIGPYSVVRELARGGMGVVYLARGPEGEEVAIKVLLAGGAGDPELLLRFRREGEALLGLEHPGILRVRELGSHKGRPYMVMDLIDGPTLADSVEGEGPPTEEQVIEWGRQVANALAYAHQRGVVHRDLKPANVILRDGRPVLVDFGLVRLLHLEQSRLTETGSILGSPAYMAPEQAEGAVEIGPAADVYALGATLYFLLCGRAPYEGKSVLAILQQVVGSDPPRASKLRADVDPQLEGVVSRCMAREPSERYATAFALEQALLEVAERAPRPRSRGTTGAALVAVALATLGVVGLGWALATREGVEGATAGGDLGGQRESETPLERGERKLASGELELALADFERALELDPQDAVAWAQHGVCLGRLGRQAEALESLARALELDPSNAEAWDKLGTVKLKLRRDAEALEAYARSLALDPTRSEVWSNRAQVRASSGMSWGAIEDSERALELDSENAGAYAALGWAKSSLGQREEGLEDLGRALELDPRNPFVLTVRGGCLKRLGRLEEAIADFSQAQDLDPALGQAWRGRAECLERLGRLAEAIADYDRALELDSGDASSYLGRGLCKAKLGRYRGAVDDCDRALERSTNPDQRKRATQMRREAAERAARE